MAKMSQTVKEITQVVVFLLVVGILILVFVIYPLNRTKAILARPDIGDFNPDSLPPNDISALVDLHAMGDHIRILRRQAPDDLAGAILRAVVDCD